jgi:hypothetical protein
VIDLKTVSWQVKGGSPTRCKGGRQIRFTTSIHLFSSPGNF